MRQSSVLMVSMIYEIWVQQALDLSEPGSAPGRPRVAPALKVGWDFADRSRSAAGRCWRVFANDSGDQRIVGNGKTYPSISTFENVSDIVTVKTGCRVPWGRSRAVFFPIDVVFSLCGSLSTLRKYLSYFNELPLHKIRVVKLWPG